MLLTLLLRLSKECDFCFDLAQYGVNFVHKCEPADDSPLPMLPDTLPKPNADVVKFSKDLILLLKKKKNIINSSCVKYMELRGLKSDTF